ncbi:MAG: WcaF family extracellular polysaccharide biosynthesis acetyltransferase [Segetibacter sp.]
MKGPILPQNKQGVCLAQYDNSWYNPGPKWKIFLWLLVSVLFFDNGFAVFSGFKCFLLRLFGAKVGKRVRIKPFGKIKYPWLLMIGSDVWIGEDVWIDNLGLVVIGDSVCVSQGALLLTGNHNYKTPFFDLMIGKIILEDGVWIGAKSTVCPGVTCKTHAVLSVSSVASTDLEAFCIYQGVPAKKIRIRTIN